MSTNLLFDKIFELTQLVTQPGALVPQYLSELLGTIERLDFDIAYNTNPVTEHIKPLLRGTTKIASRASGPRQAALLRTLNQIASILPNILTDQDSIQQGRGWISIIAGSQINQTTFEKALNPLKQRLIFIPDLLSALQFSATPPFSLTFADISLAGIAGQEFHKRYHETPGSSKTPVVYSVPTTEFAKSIELLDQTSDVLTQPIDIREIALKAIYWQYKVSVSTDTSVFRQPAF
jgi:CheY-like chemotaxis protein